MLVAIPVMAIIAFMQMIEVDEVYSPLHPLSDAKSEARRLLKIMTHYNYQCNSTSQIGNTSIFPICIDKGIGLNLDAKHKKILYTIGSVSDYTIERSLAVNYSFSTYLVTPTDISTQIRGMNNTHNIHSAIVANDPADFSRNSYGQRTFNDLLAAQGHSHIDLLRIMSTVRNVEVWQLLYFLIKDDVISKVYQLHLVVYIDKVDDEYLYNWYRTLYQLFTRSGMHLYHTSSHDPLCLQVTLMESCVYFLSFVRNPGPTVFILYPPADYGTEEQEDLRLFDYLDSPQVSCKQRTIGEASDGKLKFSSAAVKASPRWQICSYEKERSDTHPQPCVVVRFRLEEDRAIEKQFLNEKCSVYTIVISSTKGRLARSLHLYSHSPLDNSSKKMPKSLSFEEVFQFLENLGYISLIEIDAPNNDWIVLGELLNSGILQNVTQLVAGIETEDKTSGVHPTVLRSHYSQLKRLGSYGLTLFYSSRDWPCTRLREKDFNGLNAGVWCYRLGFVRLQDL